MLLAWLWLCVAVRGQERSCPDHMSLLAKPVTASRLEENEALKDGKAWHEVVESVINLDWATVNWPYQNRLWHSIARSYTFGGNMLTALLYQTCIIQVMKDPERSDGHSLLQRGDPTEALGRVLSGLSSAFGPWGKVLGGIIGGAFALFGGGPDVETLLQEALDKLHDKIMAEVRSMFAQEHLEHSLHKAGVTMAITLEQLRKLPEQINAGYTTAEVLLLHDSEMSTTLYPAIFGSDDCLNDHLEPQSSDVCSQFQMRGAFFSQLQFVLSHMGILSHLSLLGKTRTQRSARLHLMRQQLKKYLPLLKASFETYRSWSPGCGYTWPRCFGCCGNLPLHLKESCPKGFLGPCASYKELGEAPCHHCLHGGGDQCGPARFRAEGYVHGPYSVEAMGKDLGCRTDLQDKIDGQNVDRGDFCAGNEYNMCTSVQIQGLVDRFRKKLDDTFGPIFEGLEVLSEEIKDAQDEVDELIRSTEFSRRRGYISPHRRRE